MPSRTILWVVEHCHYHLWSSAAHCENRTFEATGIVNLMTWLLLKFLAFVGLSFIPRILFVGEYSCSPRTSAIVRVCFYNHVSFLFGNFGTPARRASSSKSGWRFFCSFIAFVLWIPFVLRRRSTVEYVEIIRLRIRAPRKERRPTH